MNLFFVDRFDTDTAGALPAWFKAAQGNWGVVADAAAISLPNNLQNLSHTVNDFLVLFGGGGVTIPALADLNYTYDIVTSGGVTDHLDPTIRADAAFVGNVDAGKAYTFGQ